MSMTQPLDLTDSDSGSDSDSNANLQRVQQQLKNVNLNNTISTDRSRHPQLLGSQTHFRSLQNQATESNEHRNHLNRHASRTLSPESDRTGVRNNVGRMPTRSSAPSPLQNELSATVNKFQSSINNNRPQKQPRLHKPNVNARTSTTNTRNAVDILDSSDEEDNKPTTPYQEILCQLRSRGAKGAAEIYDLTQEEEEEEEDTVNDKEEAEDYGIASLFETQPRLQQQEDSDFEIFEMVAGRLVTQPAQDDDMQILRVIPRRGNLSAQSWKILSQYKIKTNDQQFTCAPGKCVEFNDGTFMRIDKIIESHLGAISVVGHLFKRHNSFQKSYWPRRHNEVVQMVEERQGNMTENVKKSVDAIIRMRHLILTNQSYPAVSSRTHEDAIIDVHQDIEIGPLFCRWRQIEVFDDKDRLFGEVIEKLSANAADPAGQMSDSQVRRQWCKHRPPIGKKYTFGDTFCGGGGASSGADEAGLFVKFGIDLNKDAMKTYAMNFEPKKTRCIQQDIHEFIAWSGPGEHIVDVLHMSPPCQPFSPAHTVPNLLRDEANQAALFAVGELLKKLKPRIATLEQTFGLRGRHAEYFNALIKMFLDIGYSIHWRVMGLQGYGLPQTRKRLIIIAAGPGETLPSFPEFTHSATDISLKPLCTIGEKLDIPVGIDITHHNIDAAKFPPRNWRLPYSPNELAKTITTSGGIGNYHPSGKRGFTIRELATLQVFPLSYKFADIGVTALRRQIGNAVPPYVFKKFYREIINSLRKTDGLL